MTDDNPFSSFSHVRKEAEEEASRRDQQQAAERVEAERFLEALPQAQRTTNEVIQRITRLAKAEKIVAGGTCFMPDRGTTCELGFYPEGLQGRSPTPQIKFEFSRDYKLRWRFVRTGNDQVVNGVSAGEYADFRKMDGEHLFRELGPVLKLVNDELKRRVREGQE